MADVPVCSIAECGKPQHLRGFCNAHYLRWRRHGDPLAGGAPRAPRGSECVVEACHKRQFGHGFCAMHHRRWARYGDPLGGGTFKGDPLSYFESTVRTYEGDDCLIWPYAKDGGGAGRLTVEGKMLRVARMVCEDVHGAPPSPSHEAAHSCGKGHLGCVSKHHLSWKTPSANQMDRVEHGTSNRGRQHGLNKLDIRSVREIRRLEGICSLREIAARFSVSAWTVADIQKRKLWTWLP